MVKDALVIAAHPDDELLGLGSLLEGVSDVVYVLAQPPGVEMVRRLKEADELAKRYGFDTHTTIWDGASPFEFNSIERIFLPAPSDPHREHQMALTWGLQKFGAREDCLREYSIEKLAPYVVPLPPAAVEEKRRTFRTFYPSQLDQLLDPKYFLFEGTAFLGVPSITVRLKEAGFHFWKDAPSEVAFLRHPHRHLFGAAVTLKNLTHHDRDQEFFLVQDWARLEFLGILSNSETEGYSCERMARDLAIRARAKYRCSVSVVVDEDGENGAEVTV